LPQFDASGRLAFPEGDWSELTGRRDLPERIRDGLDQVEGLDRAAFVLRAVEEVPLAEAAATPSFRRGEAFLIVFSSYDADTMTLPAPGFAWLWSDGRMRGTFFAVAASTPNARRR